MELFVLQTEKKLSICSSTCDAELPDRKLEALRHQLHSFTHLREGLEDETNGHHHQQHHERRQQPCNLNAHTAGTVSTSSLILITVLQHQFSPVILLNHSCSGTGVSVLPAFSHQCSPAPGSLTWSRWWQRFGRKSWWSYTDRGPSVPESRTTLRFVLRTFKCIQRNQNVNLNCRESITTVNTDWSIMLSLSRQSTGTDRYDT